jgi:hypothetical protein
MELMTFITETQQQICDGIREAQAEEGGGVINAESSWSGQGHLFSGGSAKFTRMDIDPPSGLRCRSRPTAIPNDFREQVHR